MPMLFLVFSRAATAACRDRLQKTRPTRLSRRPRLPAYVASWLVRDHFAFTRRSFMEDKQSMGETTDMVTHTTHPGRRRLELERVRQTYLTTTGIKVTVDVGSVRRARVCVGGNKQSPCLVSFTATSPQLVTAARHSSSSQQSDYYSMYETSGHNYVAGTYMYHKGV